MAYSCHPLYLEKNTPHLVTDVSKALKLVAAATAEPAKVQPATPPQHVGPS